MQLPGRLRDTTLGDLLGTLHRSRATGTLELIESQGSRAGRSHRIELLDGRITAVHADAPGASLGELLGLDARTRRNNSNGRQRIGQYLVEAGLVSQSRLRDVLHTQMQERLEAAFALEDAAVRFRIPRPQADDPLAPEPLRKNEFLEGRPRARGRRAEHIAPPGRASNERLSALMVLGLPESASGEQIQHAFRRLAQRHHPDVHPNAKAGEKRRLLLRFAEISRAYHMLTG